MDISPPSPPPAKRQRKVSKPEDPPKRLQPHVEADGFVPKRRKVARENSVPRRNPKAFTPSRKEFTPIADQIPSTVKARRSGSGASAHPPEDPPLQSMSVRQLRTLMAQLNISSTGCIEKSELIDKITRASQPAPLPPPPPQRRSSARPVIDPAVLEELNRIESLTNASPLKLLGLPRGSDVESVKVKSRKLFRLVHPDKVPAVLHTRAQAAFHSLQKAVEEITRADERVKALVPGRIAEIRFSVESGDNLVILRWKQPPNQPRAARPEKFAVVAYGGGLQVDQGFVLNQASSADGEWIEVAISALSRKGNDQLFKRRQFTVSIAGVNEAGEGPQTTTAVNIGTTAQSIGTLLCPGLRRHNTFA